MNGKAKWAQVSWMAGALLPLVAGFTSAASLRLTQTNQPIQQDQQVAPSPDQGSSSQLQLERAKDLIGAKVVNDKGEQLGTIKDIVLTPDRSAINYVVLSHGGTLGMGDKHFAVPWSQFSLRPGTEKLFVLTGVTSAQLDQAKGFDKDHWPATASANWLGIEGNPAMMPPSDAPMPAPSAQATPSPQSRAYTAPGTSGNVAPSAPQSLDIQSLRLSKFLGTKVQDMQGENVGRLDNVMIDLKQGKLAYGIVAMRHGFAGMNRDYAAVPWTALDLTSPGIAKINADRDTLAAVAFNRDNFPNFSDPQYSRQLFDRFHVTPYWEGQNLGYIPGEEKPLPGENKSILPGDENKSILPGEENKNINPPSGMTAPNSNAAVPQTIAHKDKHALAYNPNAVETIHGTVKSVGTYRMEGTSTHGVLLHVRTDDGRTVLARLGPRDWMDRQNVIFRPGDPITITGSAAKAGKHETVVVSQVQTGNRTIDLRTNEGRPLWSLTPSESANAAGTYDYRGAYRF